ncbi:MAG: MFS transporter [[Pasteurella] aerogenes]|nr:MFS transporter [[Pasteurella] aerogenes]
MVSLESNGYVFKPHEMPFMAGSPASPVHSPSQRIKYILVGALLALNAGVQNGLLLAYLPQLRGELGLDLAQGGWVQVSYYMTYACMSIMFFKIRQTFGIARFVKISLSLMLISNILQIWIQNYSVELIARGIAGIGSSGMMVTAIFYFMQGLIGQYKLLGSVFGVGGIQFGIPLARFLMPSLFADGEVVNILIFQGAVTLLCIGCVMRLPLPPTIISRNLNKNDLVSFSFFAGGIALFCGFLVQGRIVWWVPDEWFGWMLALSMMMIGLALWLESKRRNPMLDWFWISRPQILMFGFLGAFTRVLTTEQTVGATGLMQTLGMQNEQMTKLYLVILIASALGLALSILTLKMTDLRRSIPIALLGIAIGSFMDTHIGVQTRPEQIYVSQALIAFSTLYFLGPMMIEGLVRAFAASPLHIMSYSAVFGLSQTIGGLAGAAIFSTFLTWRSKIHFADITQYFSMTDPTFAASANQTVNQFMALGNSPQDALGIALQKLISQATVEATVHAYNDLFLLVGIASTIGFIYTFCSWLYMKYTKKTFLAQELMRLAALAKK